MSDARYDALLRAVTDKLLACGATSATEAMLSERGQFAGYQRLAGDASAPRVRYNLMLDHWTMLDPATAIGLATGFGDRWLRCGAMKFFIDGTEGMSTARLSQPFSDDASNTGMWMFPPEEYRERVLRAHDAGWQCATHAIGDAAIELVLDVYREAQERNPRPDLRHRIEHASLLRPDLVERFVDFRPGDPYDGTKVSDFYNALLATGYFSSVDLRSSPQPPPDLEVPVSVALTAARRQLYTLGTGYSTDKGLKFRAGYTNRRLNESGHQFDSSMDLSKVESIVGVSYRLPRRDPRVEWLSIDAGFKYEDTASKRADTYKIGLKEYRRRPADWIETRFIDASVEDYTIAEEESREFLLIPGLSWTHKKPDSPAITRPDKGHRVSLRISGTTELIGSDAEFLQADLYGKVIVPVWPGGRLLLRAEAGATLKDKFRTLPASVRYFVGGDYSVRGYDYESLGPTDDQGLVVGGSHKLVGSIEVDQRIWGNWSLAAFADSGNAFDDFSGLTLKTGVGGGLRWYSPLGPVRVDIAFPLDKDAPDSWRLHVTLGPDL